MSLGSSLRAAFDVGLGQESHRSPRGGVLESMCLTGARAGKGFSSSADEKVLDMRPVLNATELGT